MTEPKNRLLDQRSVFLGEPIPDHEDARTGIDIPDPPPLSRPEHAYASRTCRLVVARLLGWDLSWPCVHPGPNLTENRRGIKFVSATPVAANSCSCAARADASQPQCLGAAGAEFSADA
jgi:hypothetical protein